MSGWIKLHRQITDWEWYTDHNTFRVFLHLLLTANHKDKKYKGMDLKAGTIVTSRDLLAYATGLSVRQIRTALDKLKTTNELTIKTSPQGTIIQIVNYVKYQIEASETTNKRPMSDQQTTSNKNVKNNKEINIDYFDKFWTLYGKSTDKQKCLDKFVKLTEDEIKTIFETLPVYLLQTPDKKYRKNPLTYLNGKCWNDIDINNPQVLDNPFNLPPVIVD